jgi:hypothetical protein
MEGGGLDAGALDDLPGGLEEQALLRVDGKGLAGLMPKNAGSK